MKMMPYSATLKKVYRYRHIIKWDPFGNSIYFSTLKYDDENSGGLKWKWDLLPTEWLVIKM